MPTSVRADAESASVAELLIYDVIGSDFWGDGVDAKGVVNFLAEQDDAAEIHVRINSPGGAAFEATAIYNALARDPRRVVVYIDGLAASAASLVAMAGDQIRMAKNALMMIHGATGITIGTASDHESMVEVLHKVDGTMAKTYADRSGLGQPDVESLMEAETWMDAAEAEAHGFADIVDEAKHLEASWGRRGQQVVASFRKAPQHLSPAPQQRPLHIAAQAVEEQPMDLTKICAALGLPEDAQEDTIVAAIEAREAGENIAVASIIEPDPREYASRKDLDDVRAHAKQLEAQLRDRDLEDLLVQAEGRVVFSDSDRDRYRKFVREGGMTLEALREEIENKPVSPLATQDEITARTPATDEDGLDADDQAFCAHYGLDPKVFAKNKAKRQTLKVV
jgi:ATP-dependent protease ClpP protease subunit